jgi:uncharacterized protein (TIGR02099 family)
MQRLRRTVEVAAWAAFFACAAALLVLRYAVLPQVERLRPEIVARVAALVGQPVKIGGIEAQWLGFRPQVNFSDVRIYDAEGREALVLPSVENILSWRSLAQGKLRLHALLIDGPRVTVRRDAAGALYIAGIKLVPTPGEPGLSDWLFAQTDIDVRNAEIEWRDEKRAAPPLVLSSINLHLENRGERHRFGLAARLPKDVGTSLEVRGELTAADVDDRSGWAGRAYAELGYTDFAGWRAWLDYPLDLRQAAGAARLWVEIGGGAIRQATADLALADVRAKLGDDLPLLELASVAGRLQASAAGDAYQLAARKLVLGPQKAPPLAPLEFELAWKPGGGVASANTVQLAPLAHLGEALPLPAELRRATLGLEPQGQLADLRFEWQGAINAPTQYRARARFTDLGIKPRDAVPGFAKLAGTLEATETGGHVQLESRGAEVELPRVFAEPRLAFDILSGELSWRRDGAGFSVEVPSLTFTNADLSGNAFGAYATTGEGPGTIDLSAVLSRADARHLAHYLPLGALMGEKPRSWLVKGILGGEASAVELRLRGDLRAFPFVDPAQGEFLVKARVHKGVLQYAEGWPGIDDIEAELAFERNRMDITGKSGAILGARVHDVHVSIPDLRSRTPRVLVTGQAQGATAQFLQFIDSSPLRAGAGQFTRTMSARGDGHLRLKLELPLADLRSSKADGDYELAENEIVLAPRLAPLAHAQGRIAFTQSTFALHDVSGRIFGGPVAITGGTRPGGSVEIRARGEAQPAELGPLFDHPLRRLLSGASPYVASVSLRDGLQHVVVDSSLRGVASALPPPFEKAASDALPLHVEFAPVPGGARERFAVSLGRVAAAEVRRERAGEGMRVQRAALWLSPLGQSIRLPERPGVLVYGSTSALDIDRWRALLGAKPGGSALPVSVELKVARLDIQGRRIQNLAVRASSDAGGWSAVVDADELAGKLDYSAEGAGKLVARLLHFTVPPTVAALQAASSANPHELPSIDFAAERFSARGKEFGRVELAAVRERDDWRIDRLAVANDDATLQASGRWRGGVLPSSELNFTLGAEDAGKFLARVGYPGMVLGGKADLSGSLRWLGDPAALDYPSLSGELKLAAEDGQFLEIDPGLGKLISLMNLQALPRRIALDFRDVFSKGFRFDRIEAAARVDHGLMDIRDFRMRGSAAEVVTSGQVDLAQETQNLKVRVIPSLGGSTSTAVAIVNPVAGVAAALAQHVLKNPLGQLFAREFEVTGGWADPKVVNVTVVPPPTETATQ